MAVDAGLRQMLEVYRLVRESKLRRVEAAKRVAQRHRVTLQTVMSSCTRNVGIRTDEFDNFLEPQNTSDFRDFLVKRFPTYQDDINGFFKAFEPSEASKRFPNEATKKIQTMFDDERKNLLNLLLIGSFKDRFSEWVIREDIPSDVRQQIREWLASI